MKSASRPLPQPVQIHSGHSPSGESGQLPGMSWCWPNNCSPPHSLHGRNVWLIPVTSLAAGCAADRCSGEHRGARRCGARLDTMVARSRPETVDLRRRVPPGCERITCVTAPTKESPFLRACRRQSVAHTPVWFMRQAGRSLPEYRSARKRKSMLAACMTRDLVTEITLQPLRRYHVDAAILFSDIVVPLRAVGVDVDIKAGIGPVIGHPVRRDKDLARLRDL